MDSELKTYLYNSINDIQSTIRAIDAKVGFIFVILLIPFSNLGKIFNNCSTLANTVNLCSFSIVWLVVIAIFIFSWLLAFISSVSAIISIENPSRHVSCENICRGSFYQGGLFSLSFIDSILNRNNIISKKNIDECVATLPASDQEVIKELVFEQVKLAYIRDIKSIRQIWAYKLSIVWLISGFIIYITNKLTI